MNEESHRCRPDPSPQVIIEKPDKPTELQKFFAAPVKFRLDELLSGRDNDLLSELAAKSAGWEKCADCDPPCHYWIPPNTKVANRRLQARDLPRYPADLNATRELLSNLTTEDWGKFRFTVSRVYPFAEVNWSKFYLQRSPLEITISYLLAKSLIEIE